MFAQVRPSSGVPDMKESLQVQFNGMDNIWPREDTLSGFKDDTLAFMNACQKLSKQLLRAMAIAFGLPEDFFTKVGVPMLSAQTFPRSSMLICSMDVLAPLSVP